MVSRFNPVGRYGKIVSSHPLAVILIALLVTATLGMFASQVQFSSNEEDFRPVNEVSDAYEAVTTTFGGQTETVTALMSPDGNSLSYESLISQLKLEKKIVESDISDSLLISEFYPYGVAGPAHLIAQAVFLKEILPHAYDYSDGLPVPPSPPAEGGFSTSDAVRMMLALSPDQAISVIEGKTISVPAGQGSILLSFQRYDPSMLEDIFAGVPFSDALSLLVSSDFDISKGYSSMSLLSIAFEDTPTLDQELEIQSLGAATDPSFHVLGDALVEDAISQASGTNIAIIMSLALVAVIAILLFIYRNPLDVAINIVGLVMAIIWVFGIGKLLSFSFNPAITTVPVLILGLGIDYGIHYNMRYREEIRKGKRVQEAISTTSGTVGLAILLTTVTTLIGFLSNTASDTASIRQFGILCAIGITSAFFVMLSFVPACKTILDSRKEAAGKTIVKTKKDKDGGYGWAKPKDRSGKEVVCASGVCGINKGLGLGALFSKRPLPVLIIVAIITVAGAYEASQLETRFDFRDFLPEDLDVSETTNMIFDNFSFSSEEGYILLKGDVASPTVFNAMADASETANEGDYIVSTGTIRSPYELARSLSIPESFGYIPQVGAAWSQHIDKDGDGDIDEDITGTGVASLYDALEEFAPESAMMVLARDGKDYIGAVVRIPVNSKDGIYAKNVTWELQDAAEGLERLEGGVLDSVVVTGGAPVQYEVLKSISTSQTRSVLVTIVMSLAILSALYYAMRRSLALGAVTLFPLLLVIIWTTGSMKVLSIPLNVVTVTIAAITVGIGIDYSIHITQRFLEDSEYIGSPDCSLCVTLNHTASALFGSAMTTVIGFGLLSFSIIPPLAQFGKVTALSIAFAFLAAVYVHPTLLRLWYSRTIRHKQ